MLKATKFKSCDTCQCQEDRHYCLLHSILLKNMDTKRCKDWESNLDDHIVDVNKQEEE